MKYKRIIYLFLLPLFAMSCDPNALGTLMQNAPLTDAQIAQGLKQALDLGFDESVQYLSKEGGYYNSAYKILLPAEAQKVTDKLKFIPGFDNVEEEIIRRVNAAAEDAAKKAGPIFADAIRGMSFNDVMGILMGENNAATTYLNNKTYSNLYGEFKPVIINSLNKFNALDYWADALNAYNKIPLVKKMNPDLADHVVGKSLDGLFSLIEKKEAGIRTDISQRTTDLLRRVFSKQDN
jgi:hypothetical protein